MHLKVKAIKKIVLVSFIIVFSFGPYTAKSTAGVFNDPVHTGVSIGNGVVLINNGILYFVKEFIIYPIVRKIANTLQNKIENKILGITSTLNGKTQQFVTNWRGEVLGSIGQGNDVFRLVLANTQFCNYFDSNLKQIFGADRYGGNKDTAVASCLKKEESARSCSTYRNDKCKDLSNNDRECKDFQNINPAYDRCMEGALDSCAKAYSTSIVQQVIVPGVSPFQVNAQCGLPSGFNPQQFVRNPGQNGGLATFNSLLTNNFFQAFSNTITERQNQISVNTVADQLKLLTGNGFKPAYKDTGAEADSTGAGQGAADYDACFADCRKTSTEKCAITSTGLDLAACIRDAETKCASFCAAGTGTGNADFGQACSSNNVCASNFCLGGKCAPNPKASTVDFGQACTSSPECKSPYICNVNRVCGYSQNAGQTALSAPSGDKCRPNEKFFGRCIFTHDIATPPRLFDAATAAALDKKIGRPGTANQITDIVLALFDALTTSITNSLFDFGSNKGQIPEQNYSPGAGDQVFDSGNISNNPGAPGVIPPTPTPLGTFGKTCEIEDSSTCATGLFCSNYSGTGICAGCDDTHACSGGQICDRGVPPPPVIQPNPSSTPIQFPPATGPGICVTPGGNSAGDYCFNDKQCQSGMICGKGGKCKTPNPKNTNTPTPTPTGTPTPTPTPAFTTSATSIAIGQTMTVTVVNLGPNSNSTATFTRATPAKTVNATFSNVATGTAQASFTFSPQTGDAGQWLLEVFNNGFSIPPIFNFTVTP